MDKYTKYPYLAFDFCSECGHCISVCPQGAIGLSSKPIDQIALLKSHSISFEEFLKLTKQRRSYRQFKNKPVSRDIIEKILKSTQYLPTGSNAQELEYTVLTNAIRIQKLSTKMNKKFKLAKFVTNTFPMKQLIQLLLSPKDANRIIMGPERLTTMFAEGFDPYMRKAPLVIIIHTRKRTELMHLDAGIAGHHINLACEIEGLGACWLGFHSELARYFPSIKKISLIPRKHKILATFVVGYPKLKYLRECTREKIKLEFRED
jgi:nitroreductase